MQTHRELLSDVKVEGEGAKQMPVTASVAQRRPYSADFAQVVHSPKGKKWIKERNACILNQWRESRSDLYKNSKYTPLQQQ